MSFKFAVNSLLFYLLSLILIYWTIFILSSCCWIRSGGGGGDVWDPRSPQSCEDWKRVVFVSLLECGMLHSCRFCCNWDIKFSHSLSTTYKNGKNRSGDTVLFVGRFNFTVNEKWNTWFVSIFCLNHFDTYSFYYFSWILHCIETMII